MSVYFIIHMRYRHNPNKMDNLVSQIKLRVLKVNSKLVYFIIVRVGRVKIIIRKCVDTTV